MQLYAYNKTNINFDGNQKFNFWERPKTRKKWVQILKCALVLQTFEVNIFSVVVRTRLKKLLDSNGIAQTLYQNSFIGFTIYQGAQDKNFAFLCHKTWLMKQKYVQIMLLLRDGYLSSHLDSRLDAIGSCICDL